MTLNDRVYNFLTPKCLQQRRSGRAIRLRQLAVLSKQDKLVIQHQVKW